MPCFHPLQGWRSRNLNESGKRSIVFNRTDGYADLPVEIPCGQCIGCRLERSRQWAIRCVHEASLYDDNCFITLTYSDEHLPADRSLNLRHYQLFMKRLRKKYGSNIRFFHCGEYGEKFGRPHYHACLFNFDFTDKILFKNHNDNRLYTSASLDELWPYGYGIIGSVTFDSAAYVARYIMKKVTGDKSTDHYQHINEATGEVSTIKPEYTTMSRRPGIGKGWYEKYKSDVYPCDNVVLNGKKLVPPKFYDNLLDCENPDELKRLKAKRTNTSDEHRANNTIARLQVRETIQKTKAALLIRPTHQGE